LPKLQRGFGRLTGAKTWLDEDRCRHLYRQGRVTASDLDAALRQLPAARSDERLLAIGARELSPRGSPAGGATPCAEQTVSSADTLAGRGKGRVRALADRSRRRRRGKRCWPPPRLKDSTKRRRWRSLGRRLCPAGRRRPPQGRLVASEATDEWPKWPEIRLKARPRNAEWRARSGSRRALWQELIAGLGERWTLATLLAHLSGEDIRDSHCRPA
jgi:hypothetical protein